MRDRTEYFFERVIPEPNTGCWIWIGTERKGYGVMSFGKRAKRRAHQFAYETFVEPVTHWGPDFDCCHTCDNRWCVNPQHLYRGTRSENVSDMVKRRRYWACQPGNEDKKNRFRVAGTLASAKARRARVLKRAAIRALEDTEAMG